MYNESIAYEEDIILIEMMGLCLQNLETEMQHESILQQEKQRSKLEIERLLRTSLEEENNRTNRVKQLAHRTLNSRTCISERQTALDITIANKEKTAALKHQAAIDRFRETQSNWIRNSGIDESIRQHQMKKDAIIREKNEQIFEKFYAKEQRTADILKMQERLMLDSAECVKNNSMEITEANSKHLRIARSEDGQFRAKTAQSIDQKLSRSERHLEKIKDESIRKSEENLEKRILAQFKCEQKRKLQEMERIQKASVLKIQLEKLDVYKEVQASIEYQRPNALRQVFHDTFHQEKMQHRDIRPSPGPGEYDIEYKRKTIGGYMAAKLNSSLNGNKDKISNPPPGCYDPDMSIEQTQVLAKLKARKGCLPFRGRGKADVDWMIAEAARLPGPGQYEFGSKKIPGGKFSKANTKSGIEKEIQSKSGIPGPGAYNDPTIKQITIPLAKIAKKQQIDESIHEDYEELFQSFN